LAGVIPRHVRRQWDQHPGSGVGGPLHPASHCQAEHGILCVQYIPYSAHGVFTEYYLFRAHAIITVHGVITAQSKSYSVRNTGVVCLAYPYRTYCIVHSVGNTEPYCAFYSVCFSEYILCYATSEFWNLANISS